MDITPIDCGKNGWGRLADVIDCHNRQIVGREFPQRAWAKEASRALEEACLARFGTLRPEGLTPVIRSDNGLIFQSRRFRAACKDYRLSHEFVTPYNAGAELQDRETVPEYEGRMRVASELREL